MLSYENQTRIVDRAVQDLDRASEELCRLAEQVASHLTLPHVIMRPRIYVESPGVWCAVYGERLGGGPAGYGKTPEEACMDFDRRWRYTPEQIRACEEVPTATPECP